MSFKKKYCLTNVFLMKVKTTSCTFKPLNDLGTQDSILSLHTYRLKFLKVVERK